MVSNNMTEFNFEDFYKQATGIALVPSQGKQTNNTTPTRVGGQEVFDKDEEAAKSKLKKKDLYSYRNKNIIREYMTRNKGVDYEGAEDEKLVEDFVDHMRWFNTNTVSTAGEVMFVSKGNDLDKKAAKEAYDLYDSLESMWTNDGFYGAVDGVKDYVFAAATDPTNYIGALTGGAGKAAAMGVTASSKAALKAAADKAAKRAMLNGATKEAAKKAGAEAAESMTKKMVGYAANKKVTSDAVNAAAIRARREVLAEAGAQAKKEVLKPRERIGGIYGLLGTTSADAIIAMVQADAIQDLYLDVGAQEKYSRTETILAGLLGGVGGAFHLTGQALKGTGKLGEAMDTFDIKRFVEDHPHKKALNQIANLEDRLAKAAEEFGEDSVEYKDILAKISVAKSKTMDKPLLRKEAQKEAAKIIKKNFTNWVDKVERGGRKLENLAVPESLLKTIMLGDKPDEIGGLVKLLKDSGVHPKRSTTVSDIMTNVIRYMPQEDLQDLSKSLKEVIHIDLSDTADLGMTIGDVLAADISRAGSTLSVMSQVRRALHGGVVAGNDRLVSDIASAEARELMGKEAAEAKKSRPFAYGQSIWKRLLVSSPATTMANVQGFATYSILQSVADMSSFATYSILAGAKSLTNPEEAAEMMRKANVYRAIQGQKMRNFMDANTTHDVYMRFLDENQDAKKLLFETVGNAAEASSKRYNMSENNKFLYGKFGVENLTNAASTITGVRIQDTFTKSQMFMTEMDKYLRLKHERTLADVLKSNDMGLIDDDVVGAAIDTTMRSVFSKDYTTKDQPELLRGAAKLIEGISNAPLFGTVLPFGRFANNVVATTYQWSPLALVDSMRAIYKTEKRNISNMEAMSRGVVGTGALALAMQFSEEQEKKGLDYNIVEGVGGTQIDVKNAFPFSSFLATGRFFNRLRKGEAKGENFFDMTEQLAIGQIARDVQFANDLRSVGDYMSRGFGKESDGSFIPNPKNDTLEALFKASGNIAAGVTRPLDFVNKAVGFVNGTDYSKDIRQAEGGKIFTQAATRYFDNILGVFADEIETVKGEQLRVASREGEVYDPNPLAKIFGLTIKQGRTATEKVYSMAEMKAWTQDMRTKIPEYDKVFNTTIAPVLEKRMNTLLKNKRFLEANIDERRKLIKEYVINPSRKLVREHLDATSGTKYFENQKYKASRKGDKFLRQKAMEMMRERGVDVNEVRDFSSMRELMMFNSYIEHLETKY